MKPIIVYGTSNHSRLVALVLLFALLLLMPEIADGQEQQQQAKIELDDLQSMTPEELEIICVERGFELIQDETGEELNHSDYVNAAARCLAIEDDMNEILEQNPELADELLSEIDRMKEEKDRLEHERQRMLSIKNDLEEQLKAKTAEQPVTRDNAGESGRMWGASSATALSSPQPGQSASSDLGQDPVQVDSTSSRGTAFVPPTPSDGSTTASTTVSTTPQSTGNTTLEAEETRTEARDEAAMDGEDLCIPAVTETTTTQSDPTTTSAPTSAATTTNGDGDNNKSADFSLKGFLQELMNEFDKDVHRITSLILPVVKPMLSAGSVLAKYIKVLFQGAKRQLEKYQQQSQKSDGSSSSENNRRGDATARSAGTAPR